VEKLGQQNHIQSSIFQQDQEAHSIAISPYGVNSLVSCNC